MAVEWEFRRQEVLKEFRAATVKALSGAAIVVQNEIKLTMGKHGSGRGGKPSPAGNPPAVQTGALRRSIQTDLSQVETRLRARVGSNLRYARIQEFGGTITAKNKPFLVFRLPDGSFRRVKRVRLPARPYMRPGLKNAKPKVRRIFAKLIEAAT